MTTECTAQPIVLQAENDRTLVARFDGGTICSDAGAILLKQVEQATGIIRQFAACFADYRNPALIDHTLYELIAQRVYALALGYEDLNDHDVLRQDLLLTALVGKRDPQAEPLAGKSTLNRLELTPVGADRTSRYKKIVVHRQDVDRFFVDAFIQSYGTPPERIVLDLDATDDPVHGDQLGKFFHGYYGHYCYLPLYIFCGDHLLCARLRPADIDGAAGSVKELDQIVRQIRQAWPQVQIIVRGDSGFCREEIMAWCESHSVDYVLGLAKNARLIREIGPELAQARELAKASGQAARVYKDFQYQTLSSWSRSRRVVGKAEVLPQGDNPRFVVTSLSPEQWQAQPLYEDLYCARGEMENRIKEQQLYLFADRTSCATMRANQTRLWFSSVAYMLLEALRRLGLKGTDMAQATCQTIRLKLLKIGAQIQVTVRKVWVRLSQSYPYQALFRAIHENLTRSQRCDPLRC
jgi:hypothetical protein